MRPQRLGHRDAQQADRTGSTDHDAFTGDQAAQFGQTVHRRARGDDQRRFLVGHRIADLDQRVDVVDRVGGKTAIRREAIRAMALVHISVIQAVIQA